MRLILFLIFSNSVFSFGQNHNFIEGYVINERDKTPLPYVKVYNTTLQSGVLTNTDGYFKITINSVSDSITLNYIGFNKLYFSPEKDKRSYILYLKESSQVLDAVSVTARDNSYLFNYLKNCKKNRCRTERIAKAYYELKTSVNDKTIEIVENFYNANVKGYDLQNLALKAGRFGLQFYKNRTFVSMESSRAITSKKIFDGSNLFPVSPLQLSKRELKKNYYIKLKKKYKNEDLDSIYVLNLKPKDTLGHFFKSKIWLNPIENSIIKVELNCNNVTKHPFVPIFPTDTIKSVDLEIVKSFKKVNHTMYLDHIDFNYTIAYKYRQGETYFIKTNAVIHIYDFENQFYIPKFKYSDDNIGDYKKISALPYNAFFWNNHDELKVSHKDNTNEIFINQPTTLTNKTIFTENDYIKIGLLENPFMTWDKKRVTFKKVISDTLDKTKKKVNEVTVMSEQYNLGIKIFLDFNRYKDSTSILTSTVFDPYDSFYYLPLNKKANCFINIYFDLIEIERRRLENEISLSDLTIKTVEHLYSKSMHHILVTSNKYFNSVERGNNQKEMEIWNTKVYNELRINNIELFRPYTGDPIE